MRTVLVLLALSACGRDSSPPPRVGVSVAPPVASATAPAAPPASVTAAPEPVASAVDDASSDGGDVLAAVAGGSDLRAALGDGGAQTFSRGTFATGGGSRALGGGPGRGVPRPPHVRIGALAVSGSMPPEIIRRVVRSRYLRVRSCYAKGIEKNPALEGRIVLKLVIDGSGRVSSAQSTLRSTLPDMAVVSCVVTTSRALRFPRPKAGVVTVIYPLILTPAD